MTGPTESAGVFAPATFTPDPRPAAPLRRITATAGLELKVTLRNGEQLLLALVIPLVALVGGVMVTVIDLPEPRIDAVAARGDRARRVLLGVHLAGDHHRL